MAGEIEAARQALQDLARHNDPGIGLSMARRDRRDRRELRHLMRPANLYFGVLAAILLGLWLWYWIQ